MTAISGLDRELARLRKLQADVNKAKKKGEKRAADMIAADAKSKAKGNLASKIYVTQSETTTTVIGGDDLSAYNEFGTGDFAAAYLASMPPEVKEEAIKFYVDGSGRIPAAPFFFPAIFKNRDKVLLFVEEEINKLNK